MAKLTAEAVNNVARADEPYTGAWIVLAVVGTLVVLCPLLLVWLLWLT